MAIRIEQVVVDDLIPYMSARFATALNNVSTDNVMPLPAPQRQNYFIGEPSRYRPYSCPCVFVVDNVTVRPGEASGSDWGLYDHQRHRIWVGIRVEERDEERLTKACWRYARAADQCLHNASITSSASYKCEAFVQRILYGAMFADKDQRFFRKEIRLELEILFFDVITMGTT